jgi:hypothetical protein
MGYIGGGLKRPMEEYGEEDGSHDGGSMLKKRRGEGPQVEMRVLVPSKVSQSLELTLM